MTLEARKLELVSYILQIENEAVLDKLKSVIEDQDEKPVASTINGNTLTKSEYISEIRSAELQIEKGDYMTHEAVKIRLLNGE
jgi:hypothetical protein